MRSLMSIVALGGLWACVSEEGDTGNRVSSLGVEESPGHDELGLALVRTYPGAPPIVTDVVGYDPAECGIPGSIHPDPACRTDADGDTVAAAFDCDDGDSSRSPNQLDPWCDAIDQNCNGYDECDADRDGIQAAFDRDDFDPTAGARPWVE